MGEIKILHVVDQFNQVLHGGPGQVAYHLAEAQVKSGNKVTIFTSSDGLRGQPEPAGVKVFKFHTFGKLMHKLVVTPGMYFKSYGRFDVVHLHNYRVLPHVMVCDSFGGPIILQAHGNCRPLQRWDRPLWRNAVFKKCSRYIADADLEISHYLNEGAEARRIARIPVGVATDEFNYVKPTARNGHRNILYLGRLAEIKGLDLLVKAFYLLGDKNATLTLAGADYMGFEAKLRRMVRVFDVEDRVHFIGPVYGQSKAKLYGEADVFVLPSRYEMWGLAFMEALASGTPVILSDACGSAKELPEKCGKVVPLDEAVLAGALREMLRNDFAHDYREYRKAWACRYDWQNIARETVKLYQEALLDKCMPIQ